MFADSLIVNTCVPQLCTIDFIIVNNTKVEDMVQSLLETCLYDVCSLILA
jgi:hypothetical protein